MCDSLDLKTRFIIPVDDDDNSSWLLFTFGIGLINPRKHFVNGDSFGLGRGLIVVEVESLLSFNNDRFTARFGGVFGINFSH